MNNSSSILSDSVDNFISKYDDNFNLLWVKTWRFNGSTYLSVNNQNELILSGYFYNETDFNFGNDVNLLSPYGEGDIYVLKLNSNGELVWVKHIGSANWEETFSIHTNQSNIYIGGYFNDTIDFNIGLESNVLVTSENSSDMFILKLNSENVGVKKENLTSISIYPNPTNGLLNIQLSKNDNNTQLNIVDYSGKLVFNTSLNDTYSQLDLTFLSSGVYFINLIFEDGEIISSKIIINN